MEVDIDAAGEQLRIFQDQYKETSQEYDRLFEELNKTSEVQQHRNDQSFSSPCNIKWIMDEVVYEKT